MNILKIFIAATTFSSSFLLATPVFAQRIVNALLPGKATRPEVERALGKPVRLDAPTFAEYKSHDASSKIFVQYREVGAVVERIEVFFPNGKERKAALASFGLSGKPSHQQTNYLDKLEEYYAPSKLVLTYRGGDVASGVHRVSYFSPDAFAAALARAGGAASPPGQADEIATAKEERVHFDQIATGPLATDVFEHVGMRIVESEGAPGIYGSEPNMILPAGRSRVLLLAGARTTSLTLQFDAPIQRFSLTRIGTAGGASVPTWTLKAFNSAGEVLDSSGEEHGLPLAPRQFSVGGADIVRIILITDNRFGEGTWATWNSLPIAEIEFKR